MRLLAVRTLIALTPPHPPSHSNVLMRTIQVTGLISSENKVSGSLEQNAANLALRGWCHIDFYSSIYENMFILCGGSKWFDSSSDFKYNNYLTPRNITMATTLSTPAAAIYKRFFYEVCDKWRPIPLGHSSTRCRLRVADKCGEVVPCVHSRNRVKILSLCYFF